MKIRRTIAALVLSLLASGCATGPERPEVSELAAQGYDALAAGDLQTAETLLTQALAEQPDDPNIQVALGEVYQQTGRLDEAREMYLRVLQAEPQVSEGMPNPATRARQHLEELYLAEVAETAQPEPAQTVSVEPAPFSHWVQVGYFSSPGNADRHWQSFSRRFPNIAQNWEVRFLEIDRGTKIRLGPYESLDAARQVCNSIRRNGEDCFPGSGGP